jgi:hypothetical protein
VTTRDRRGRTQSGTFSRGGFVLTQTRGNRPLTGLRLVGGDFGACASAARKGATAARRRVRSLFGHAHGRFRSRGRSSSATVRGTKWVTEDTCEGTRTDDLEGKVHTQGEALAYDLDAGQSVQFFCDADGQAPVSSLYCLAVLSQPADNIFAFGIATLSPPELDNYDLCITAPDGSQQCNTYAFDPPDSEGFRVSGVGCIPGGGPGDYSVRWRLGGQDLGVPLPFTSVRPRAAEPFCTTG